MSRERKLTLLIAVLALLGAVFLAADPPRRTEPSEARATKRVLVAKVEAAHAERRVRFSGVLRAVDRARLAFVRGGRLTARPVEVGERVREGQVLARLDTAELENAVDAARAASAELAARRAQVERDMARVERLAAAKAATEEEVERTAAGLEALRANESSAAARLREAERRLREAVLRAPFAGTVTEVLAEPGEHAAAGRPVVMLSGDGAVELEVELPETLVSRVATGDRVLVDLPALGVTGVGGEVTSVARTAVGGGRLFPVVAKLEPSARALAGMTGELVLELAEDHALALPLEAVVNPGGQRPAVFRLRGERVDRVAIEVLGLIGERVTVRGELAPGDEVVVGGQRGLLDGERVEVVR